MTARDALSKEPVIWCFHGNRPHECPHCTPTSKEQLSAGERRFVEARVTKEAGIANRPIVGRPEPFSAGLLLYSYVYEARWAGLRTAEICPRWQDLPDSFRLGWEQLARELATHAPVETT